jgi:hypothetical protein
MSNPVPKQKKSRQNSALHTQEGIDVCVPNPPQTPPIQRSFLDLASLCNQFLSDIFPPFVAAAERQRNPGRGNRCSPRPVPGKAVLCFLHIILRKGKQFYCILKNFSCEKVMEICIK